jgi:hypothetical protein
MPDSIIIILILLISFQFLGGSILYITGYSISKPFYRIFIKQLAGVTASVTVTALIYTGGITVTAGFLLTAAGFYFQKRVFRFSIKGFLRQIHTDYKEWCPALFAFAALLLMIAIQHFHLYPASGMISIPHPDYVFYARVSVWMAEYGTESFMYDFFYPQTGTPAPYHYMELWLNTLVTRITGRVPLINLMTVTYSYSLFLTWLALASLSEAFTKSKTLIILMATAIMFYTPLKFMAAPLNFLDGNLHVFQKQNVFAYLKITVIFWFLTPALISLLKGSKIHALLFLAALSIAYISAAPAAVAAMTTITAIMFYCRENLRHTIIPWLVIAFISLFYLPAGSDTGHLSLYLNEFVLQPEHWITSVNIIGKTILQHLISAQLPLTAMLILWLWPARQQKHSPRMPIVVMAVMLATGLGAWSLLHRTLNAHQLFTNVANVIFPVVFLILTLMNLNAGMLKKKISLMIFIPTIAWGIYNYFTTDHPLLRGSGTTTPEKLKAIEDHFKNQEPLGVFFLQEALYHNIYYHNHRLLAPAHELDLLFARAQATPLYATPQHYTGDHRDFHTLQRYLQNAPFYRFMQQQPAHITHEEAMIQFIRLKQVNFIAAPLNYTLPAALQPLIKKIIEPGKEGEIIYVLSEK